VTTYTQADSIDALSNEQLELILRSENDVLISWLEENSIFDSHRIRLMLDLGAVEAKRRLSERMGV